MGGPKLALAISCVCSVLCLRCAAYLASVEPQAPNENLHDGSSKECALGVDRRDSCNDRHLDEADEQAFIQVLVKKDPPPHQSKSSVATQFVEKEVTVPSSSYQSKSPNTTPTAEEEGSTRSSSGGLPGSLAFLGISPWMQVEHKKPPTVNALQTKATESQTKSSVWMEIFHFEDDHCQVLSNSDHMVGFYNETDPHDPLHVTYFYADPHSPLMVGPPPAVARNKYELQVLRGGHFVAPLNLCNAFLAKGEPFYEMNTMCDLETGHTYHQQFSDAACTVATSDNKFNDVGKCYKSTVPGMKSYTVTCRGSPHAR